METNQALSPKVLQFGEGNFLRAFVDWMLQIANESLNLNLGVIIVQPLSKGLAANLKQQNCKYNVILEGINDGAPVREVKEINCILDAINPYIEYQKYKDYFLDPELEFIISNTTEAGISRLKGDDIFAQPPDSFPAKIVALLYERFKLFNGDPQKGLSIICCELIENNATFLKEIVVELAMDNKLSSEFISWLNNSCSFCNSLVDRIVTGFPKDSIEEIQKELGVEDNMVVIGEYFHLWAIQGNELTKARLPLHKAGLNVLWLDELTAFRDKKVRILNGAHTALVPVGLLSGYPTVKEAFSDEVIANYIHSLINNEVLPNIAGNAYELKQFADKILERFHNPYLKHHLKDISLNSISKWVTRDWPSLIDYYKRKGKLPKRLSVSLAALLVLYSPYNKIDFQVNDTVEHVNTIRKIWEGSAEVEEKVGEILVRSEIWGNKIAVFTELHKEVSSFVCAILSKGINAVLIDIEK